MIDLPRVISEEPTAATPHGGIRGGESQQRLSYPTFGALDGCEHFRVALIATF